MLVEFGAVALRIVVVSPALCHQEIDIGVIQAFLQLADDRVARDVHGVQVIERPPINISRRHQ